MLLWRWSADYDTPAKRKKHTVKFGDITSQFAKTEDHPAIGDADVVGFARALDDEFGADEERRPFVVERHSKCVVVNYPNTVRFDLAPRVAAIGRRFDLNASGS
ncbi:MAG TPA: hypothetical protein PLF78_09140 [Caulobacter sp.]|nr:hypothetical protein [Caulobacter sp.]